MVDSVKIEAAGIRYFLKKLSTIKNAAKNMTAFIPGKISNNVFMELVVGVRYSLIRNLFC